MPDLTPGSAPERPAESVRAGVGGGPATLEPPLTDESLDEATIEALGLEEVRLSQRQLVWRRFRRHKLAMASAVILLLLIIVVLLAPVLAPYGFEEQHLRDTLQAPNSTYLLGTDTLGRDQLSRIIYGGRVSLAV